MRRMDGMRTVARIGYVAGGLLSERLDSCCSSTPTAARLLLQLESRHREKHASASRTRCSGRRGPESRVPLRHVRWCSGQGVGLQSWRSGTRGGPVYVADEYMRRSTASLRATFPMGYLRRHRAWPGTPTRRTLQGRQADHTAGIVLVRWRLARCNYGIRHEVAII